MNTADTAPTGATNPTEAELDALAQGSIVIILDGFGDQWPEAFLRYGSGWTTLQAGHADYDIPSEGLLVRPEQIVTVVWDAAATGQGRTVSTELELLAVPEGALVRGVQPRSNPVWPVLLRRALSLTGGEFLPSSPDLGRDPVPVGAAARYYGDLTVIWSPGWRRAESGPGGDPVPSAVRYYASLLGEPASTEETP